MYPLTHFLVAFFIGILMVVYHNFSYLDAFITGLVGLLIDIDHYIYYIVKKKNLSFRSAWNAAINGVFGWKERTFIHHLPGFFIITLILVLLFFVSKLWFWILFIGYYSHMILDYVDFDKWFGKDKKIGFNLFGLIISVHKYELVFDVVLILLLFAFLFL